MMRILLSSYHNPHFETITEYIEQAILELGHELIVFDDRQHIIPGRIRKRINFLHRYDLRVINKNLLSAVDLSKPDLVIVAGGHRIEPETIKAVKTKNIVTVLWTIDAPLNFEPIIKAAPFYNYIFCQGTEAVDLLTDSGIKGARWLPVGCSLQFHQNNKVTADKKKKFAFDVVFVGSYYPVRKELFEELTQFNIGIWGPGWENIEGPLRLRNAIKGAMLRSAEWLQVYNSSRIVLAPHYQDPNGIITVNQASPRMFEALACGAFVIADRQKDVLALFRDKEHLVYYKDRRDIKEKIQYYLTHPNKRKRIALNGNRYVIENHTFTNRIQEMLSFMFP